MRRLANVKYVVVGAMLLVFGFVAGTSLRGWAQAKNPSAASADAAASTEQNSSTAVVTALFSPEDNIQKTLVNTINNAQRSAGQR